LFFASFDLPVKPKSLERDMTHPCRVSFDELNHDRRAFASADMRTQAIADLAMVKETAQVMLDEKSVFIKRDNKSIAYNMDEVSQCVFEHDSFHSLLASIVKGDLNAVDALKDLTRREALKTAFAILDMDDRWLDLEMLIGEAE
jgi:hypothetical protein